MTPQLPGATKDSRLLNEAADALTEGRLRAHVRQPLVDLLHGLAECERERRLPAAGDIDERAVNLARAILATKDGAP